MSDTLAVMGRPKKAEKTVQVRITITAARKARAIAAALDMDLPDWLSPVVEKAADEQRFELENLFGDGGKKSPRKTG